MTEKLLVPDIGDFENVEVIELLIKEGQEITVFVAGIDKQGRVKLEWKDKPQAPKEEVPAEVVAESAAQKTSADNQEATDSV